MQVHLLTAAIELVKQAGNLIVHEAERSGGPRGTGDKADIDIEVEQLLRAGLLQLSTLSQCPLSPGQTILPCAASSRRCPLGSCGVSRPRCSAKEELYACPATPSSN